MSQHHLIIVGGVAAGMSAAAKARRTDPSLKITVYEKSGYVSYGACSFPYFIAGVFDDESQLVARTPEQFAKQNIHVNLHHEVLRIDPDAKSILVRDLKTGREFEKAFDRLVLTTGGRATKPPLPGVDLNGIFTLRTVEDALAIKRWILDQKPRHGVVVGAGYIGLEMAEALAAHGIEVNMVEMLPQPMPNIDADIARLIAKELDVQKVGLYVNHRVERFEGENNKVTRVISGERAFPAEIVIVATGVRPNVGLAENAGIKLGPTGAVAVDEHQRTNIPDIFAAGDVAEALDRVTGRPTWVPLGTTANKQGRVAGENAAGGDARFQGIVGTAVVKVFDLQIARTGLSERQARNLGYNMTAVKVTHASRPGYYPGSAPITLKLIFEREGGRLLGAQMAGRDGVGKRIDVLAAALQAGWTVADLAELDLAYAPPFAPTWDVTLIAANQALKRVIRPLAHNKT
ncbi:MAG: CoA-disulfide reductase [Chloroflexi bacterium]|nr:CoA-disulfide reductase [Chloroflexota bacterium]